MKGSVVNATPEERTGGQQIGLDRVGEGLEEDTVTGHLRGEARQHGSVRRDI